MFRTFTVVTLAALGLAACVTIPNGERTVASWSNGVQMTQLSVTAWSGASPMDREEGWARNTSSAVQCLALKSSNTSGYVQTWTLRPGTHEFMFPQIGEFSTNRFIPGRYGSWTPANNGGCESPPADLPLTRVGGGG